MRNLLSGCLNLSVLYSLVFFRQDTPALLQLPVTFFFIQSLRCFSVPLHSTLLRNTGLFLVVPNSSIMRASVIEIAVDKW